MKFSWIVFLIFFNFLSVEAQLDVASGLDTPREYEIGPIRIVGADNFDHQAIKVVAGLRQGQKITTPGDQISTAIRNLWKEELFSDIAIDLDKEIG